MNFLFLLPTDRLGGAERVAMNLVRYLSSNKQNKVFVYFLSLDNSGCWDEFINIDNVSINYAYKGSVKFGFVSFLVFYKKLIESADLVYSTHAHVNSLLCLSRRLSLFKCGKLVLRESSILSMRFSGLKKLLIDLIYLSYGNQDLLICQTSLMREKISSHRGERIAKNSKVIPNPIDIDAIVKLSNNNVVMKANPGTFSMIMVGRLIHIKNHKLVLEALRDVKESFTLTIVGDGELRGILTDLCREYDLLDKVEFIGNVKNPYQYMAKADLGIISSFSEGFPNVLIEMMASGTNDIVITPCTGDLDAIPSITVTDGFSVEEMRTTLANKIKLPLIKNEEYKDFVQLRDVDNYWAEIQEALEFEYK
ncbi:glycosyltransferase [Vibrio litoralis]|uniref:glycosyltransferase n=1 Tax=Vibrio litoralis TaxID=335972 RepID=UPI0004224254|nr:glycosyltransferase [Vibrio litoralis]